MGGSSARNTTVQQKWPRDCLGCPQFTKIHMKWFDVRPNCKPTTANGMGLGPDPGPMAHDVLCPMALPYVPMGSACCFMHRGVNMSFFLTQERSQMVRLAMASHLAWSVCNWALCRTISFGLGWIWDLPSSPLSSLCSTIATFVEQWCFA